MPDPRPVIPLAPERWHAIARAAITGRFRRIKRQTADDCIGAALVRFAETAVDGHLHMTISAAGRLACWAAIDFIRNEYGRGEVRKSGNHAARVDPHDTEISDHAADERADVVASVAEQFALARVAELPERLRFVVFMRLAGWEHHEIGAQLGVSESRACQLHREALQELRGRVV